MLHRQGDLVDADQLSAFADMLMTTSPNVMVYAALDGWRRQMVQHGHHLLDAALTLAGQLRQDIDALPGLHVLREEFLGAEASHDLDPLHVVIDVSDLGVTGYDAADWLRENHRLDMGLSDHRRIEATFSLADDDQTAARLLSALIDLTKQASTLPPARQVELPSAAELELEPAMLPPRRVFRPEGNRLGRPGGRTYLRRADHPVPARHTRHHPRGAHHRLAPGLPAQRRQRGHATPRRRRSRPRHDQGRQPALTAISGTRTDQMLSSCRPGRPAPPTDRTGSTNLTRLPARVAHDRSELIHLLVLVAMCPAPQSTEQLPQILSSSGFYPIFYPVEQYFGAKNLFPLVKVATWRKPSEYANSLPSWLCRFDSRRPLDRSPLRTAPTYSWRGSGDRFTAHNADSLRLIPGARTRLDARRVTILALPVTGGSGTRGPVRAGRGWLGRATAGCLRAVAWPAAWRRSQPPRSRLSQRGAHQAPMCSGQARPEFDRVRRDALTRSSPRLPPGSCAWLRGSPA